MVYDVLEVFKERYEEKGDTLILGNYTLKDGLYVKIDKEGICYYFEAKTIRREKIFQTIEGVENSKALDWFKKADYYSSYLNSNKSLFDKKIHNINYLSLYFKAENHKYIKNKIREHFLVLLSFKKFKDKKEKEILNSYENQIKSFSRKRDIAKKYRILEACFDEVVKKSHELEIKNYVKIFFEEKLEKYRDESNVYLSLKIFNDNKYSKKIDNLIYGLSNSNLGMGGGLSSSKKPFFQQKTRGSVLPFMILTDNALLLKKFFDWLKLQPYSKDRYLDEHFFMQKQSKNDEAEIKEFDYIPLKKDDVEKHFKSIKVKNYLKIKDKEKNIIQDYTINELWQLEEKVNELFYNNQLIFNYYKDDIKVSSFMSKELQKLLFITKYGMNNYFRKFDNRAFENIIKKYGTAFVLDGLRNSRVFKAKNALNLKFALLGEEMDIEKVITILEKRLIEEGNYGQLERDEFMFLSGQWAYYLLKQSNSIDKTFSLAEHYFKARNLQRLKKALSSDFEKYKHAIYRESKRVRKVIALIKSYESEQERLIDSDKDMFLVGFTVDNLVYNKKKVTENV